MATPLLKDVGGVARIDPQFLPPTPHGSWSSVVIQQVPVSPNPYVAIQFDTQNVVPYQIAPVGAAPYSQFKCSSQGCYKVVLNLNWGPGSPLPPLPNTLEFNVFVRKNGIAVPLSRVNSGCYTEAVPTDGDPVWSHEWFVDMNAGDTIDFVMGEAGLAIELYNSAAVPPTPGNPSASVNILKISNL